MSNRDYPDDDRPFFANPQRRSGGFLWRISRAVRDYPFAELLSLVIGFIGAGGSFLFLAEFGDVASLIGVIIALVWLFSWITIAEFTGEEMCDLCEYPQNDSNNFCPSCGHPSGQEVAA